MSEKGQKFLNVLRETVLYFYRINAKNTITIDTTIVKVKIKFKPLLKILEKMIILPEKEDLNPNGNIVHEVWSILLIANLPIKDKRVTSRENFLVSR